MGNRLNKINIRFTVRTDENVVIPVMMRPLLQPMMVILTPQTPVKEIQFKKLEILVNRALIALSNNRKISTLYKIDKVEYIKEIYNNGGFINTTLLVLITVEFFSKQSLDTFFHISQNIKSSFFNRTTDKIEELQIDEFVIEKNFNKTTDILLSLPYQEHKKESTVDIMASTIPVIAQAVKSVTNSFKTDSSKTL